MPGQVGKWRPSLWLVLGGALAGTLALSFLGLVALRYLGPEIGFRNAATLLALIIAGLTAVLWWLLLRLLLRPITALAGYAASVRATPDEPAAPPAHFGTRELSRMGVSVIDMAATLQDREATIRSYTDHVTHELKTPVTAITAATELLEDSEDLSAEDRRLVTQIRSAGAQIEGQLEALRHVMRAREASYRGTCTLADLADDLRRDHRRLTLSIAGETTPLPLACKGLGIVLQHLLANAREMGADAVTLAARDGTLTVTDNGPGISSGNLPHIFEPFYTTRRDAGGTGMGLAIVSSLLAAHGARIEALSQTAGARFVIRFAAA